MPFTRGGNAHGIIATAVKIGLILDFLFRISPTTILKLKAITNVRTNIINEFFRAL